MLVVGTDLRHDEGYVYFPIRSLKPHLTHIDAGQARSQPNAATPPLACYKTLSARGPKGPKSPEAKLLNPMGAVWPGQDCSANRGQDEILALMGVCA